MSSVIPGGDYPHLNRDANQMVRRRYLTVVRRWVAQG